MSLRTLVVRRATITAAAVVVSALTLAPAPAAAAADPVIRSYHAATLLNDGRVLVTGGGSREGDTSAALLEPNSDTWSVAEPMAEPRVGHTSTLLADGKVLVTGGGVEPTDDQDQTKARASAEVYDPGTGKWALTAGPMAQGRQFHTATLLTDGRVLIIGGQARGHGPYFASAEVFDPASRRFMAAGELPEGRSFHTATRLRDGRVLVAGGAGAAHAAALRDAAVYDPSTNSWTTVPHLMTAGRYGQTSTLLPDGTVLVAGGSTATVGMQATDLQDSTEIYDPATGAWLPSPPMSEGRYLHSATSLPDGRVLVLGGADAAGRSPSVNAEIYDSRSRAWTAAPPMATPTRSHTATLIGNRILLLSELSTNDAGQTDPGIQFYSLDFAGASSSTPPPSVGTSDGQGDSGSGVPVGALVAIVLVVLGAVVALVVRRRGAGGT